MEGGAGHPAHQQNRAGDVHGGRLPRTPSLSLGCVNMMRFEARALAGTTTRRRAGKAALGECGAQVRGLRDGSPSFRMSAGTRSRAITATAPASSAMRASSTLVTSMMTPPLSIWARPTCIGGEGRGRLGAPIPQQTAAITARYAAIIVSTISFVAPAAMIIRRVPQPEKIGRWRLVVGERTAGAPRRAWRWPVIQCREVFTN